MDLPDPLGPRTAPTWPGRARRETPFTAGRSAPGYRKTSDSASSSGGDAGARSVGDEGRTERAGAGLGAGAGAGAGAGPFTGRS